MKFVSDRDSQCASLQLISFTQDSENYHSNATNLNDDREARARTERLALCQLDKARVSVTLDCHPLTARMFFHRRPNQLPLLCEPTSPTMAALTTTLRSTVMPSRLESKTFFTSRRFVMFIRVNLFIDLVYRSITITGGSVDLLKKDVILASFRARLNLKYCACNRPRRIEPKSIPNQSPVPTLSTRWLTPTTTLRQTSVIPMLLPQVS